MKGTAQENTISNIAALSIFTNLPIQNFFFIFKNPRAGLYQTCCIYLLSFYDCVASSHLVKIVINHNIAKLFQLQNSIFPTVCKRLLYAATSMEVENQYFLLQARPRKYCLQLGSNFPPTCDFHISSVVLFYIVCTGYQSDTAFISNSSYMESAS